MNTRPVLVDQYGNPLLVDITGISDGDVLTYESSSGLWIPAAGAGGDISAHLADTTDAHDASAVSIVDSGGYFTGTEVEAALQELGAAIGGASDWTTVTKAADEDVTSSTTLQDDNHLSFAGTSDKIFLWELLLIISSNSGGGGTTSDIKFNLGEDSTSRGMGKAWGWNFTSGVREDIRECNLGGSTVFEYGTTTAKTLVYVTGSHLGNGGTFKLQWAQRVSDAGYTRVHAGSILRYQQLD